MEFLNRVRRLFTRPKNGGADIGEDCGTGKFRAHYQEDLTRPSTFADETSRAAQLEQKIEAVAARRRERRAVTNG